MWILLSKEQQWRAWRHLFPALAIKVTVLLSSFEHNQKTLGRMRTNHHTWGEPGPWPPVQMLPNPSVTHCCHHWVRLGIALSLAPQHSLWWPRMFSSQLATCSWQRWWSSRSTPAQTKMFPSLPEYCQPHLNTPLVLKHKLRMSLWFPKSCL